VQGLSLRRRWVLAALAALTLGAGTFASANYFAFRLDWIPLIGVTHPPQTPPCEGVGTVDTAWVPTAAGDPATGGNGAFVITAVHVTTSVPAGSTANNLCAGRKVDVVLNGSSAPYPVPDALFGGPMILDASGKANWIFTPAQYVPAGPFTGVIVAIT